MLSRENRHAPGPRVPFAGVDVDASGVTWGLSATMEALGPGLGDGQPLTRTMLTWRVASPIFFLPGWLVRLG
jgi:hypothetical protein